MYSNRQWVLAQRPAGEPDLDCFALHETETAEPTNGEILVETRYLSVDPYMRGRMSRQDSYAEPWAVGEPLEGGIVGEVVETASDAFDIGDLVTGQGRWAEYSLIDAADVAPVDPSVAPPEAYLGILGMPGRTAYFGLLEVGDPAPGDTVVISGAAGAVGSVVGQIAKLNGCHVVGFAGTDEKTRWLTEDLGFDAAINYKTTDDYQAAVTEAAPDGVDVYYVGDFASRFEVATEQLSEWVSDSTLEHRESIVEGLSNAPKAFLGLFAGDNIGKQVVQVSSVS